MIGWLLVQAGVGLQFCCWHVTDWMLFCRRSCLATCPVISFSRWCVSWQQDWVMTLVTCRRLSLNSF